MVETAIALRGQRAIQALPTLGELVEMFLAGLDVAQSSRATYSRQLRRFVAWLEQTGRMEKLGARAFDGEDILAYRQALQEQGLSAYSVNGYLTSVRKFFQWLESRRVYPNVAKVKGLRKPRGHRKDTLSREQLREILDSLDKGSQDGLRDFALINLMARTGLRSVEVARAQVGDIRYEAGHPVLWIQGKGRDSKDDFVLLVKEAYQPIKAYLGTRGRLRDEDPLFCSHSDRNKGRALTVRSISRIVKQALRRAGLDSRRLSAHSLRHSAITLSILGGASLHQAQAMARHSSADTTAIYFHNLARVEAGAERYIQI